MEFRLIVSKHAQRVLVAAAAVFAGGALAQPSGEFATPPPARAPRLDANDPGCRPVYPEAARALQVGGESHLILSFDAGGKFTSVRMLRGADATPQQRELDIAAAKALSTCPFSPGHDADGKPVGGDIELTYHWMLEPPRDGGPGRILVKGRECSPDYPAAALRAHAQGVTRLAFHLDETGKVLRTDIVQSSGETREHRLLDTAAAQTLATCPFQPIQDAAGKPIAGTVTLSYTWRIE